MCYTMGMEAQMSEPNKRPTFVPDEDAITSGEAAEILGLCRQTVRRHIEIGKIVAVRDFLSGNWRVSRSNVQDILDARNGRPGKS